MHAHSSRFPGILLAGVTVLDSKSPFDQQLCDIRLKDGLVQEIAPANTLKPANDEKLITAEGLAVSPGWVDLLAYLSDPGHEFKETVGQFRRAAISGGFTDVLCYPDTAPLPDDAQGMEALKNKTQGEGTRLHLAGALTHNQAGKDLSTLYDMQLSGASAFTDGVYHPVQDAGMLMRALQYTQPFGGRIFQYPCDLNLAGDGQMNEGTMATLNGMKGIPEMAELIAGIRDLEVLEYAGGTLHYQPLTSTSLIERVATKSGIRPTMAVSALHLWADDSLLKDFDSFLKVTPPLRDKDQVLALRKAVASGAIQALVSLHHAQGLEEKEVEFAHAEPGMLGLQTAFSLSWDALVNTGLMNPSQLVDLWSYGPRAILNLEPITIDRGQAARFTLFQPEMTWVPDNRSIPSVAKNSWFVGKTLPVKVNGIITESGYFSA